MLNATTRYKVASATAQGIREEEGKEPSAEFYVTLRPVDKTGRFISGGQDLNLTVLKPLDGPGVTVGILYDVAIKEVAPGK
jgi:hypothetical protein